MDFEKFVHQRLTEITNGVEQHRKNLEDLFNKHCKDYPKKADELDIVQLGYVIGQAMEGYALACADLRDKISSLELAEKDAYDCYVSNLYSVTSALRLVIEGKDTLITSLQEKLAKTT